MCGPVTGLGGRGLFLAELRKRFVTGCDIDIRANYGFTSKRTHLRPVDGNS